MRHTDKSLWDHLWQSRPSITAVLGLARLLMATKVTVDGSGDHL